MTSSNPAYTNDGNTASISIRSLFIAWPCVGNHFTLVFVFFELLVQEYVVPCPTFSDITAISMPRCVALVVVTFVIMSILGIVIRCETGYIIVVEYSQIGDEVVE